MTKYSILFALFNFCLVISVNGYGQFFQNLTIGNAKASALGNAVTADPPGIDSIHYNPAGLAKIKRRQYTLKMTAGIIRKMRVTFDATPEYMQILNQLEITDPILDDQGHAEANFQGNAAYLPGASMKKMSDVMSVPMGGVVWGSPDSRFTFANNVYAPVMFGRYQEAGSPLVYNGKQLALSRITYLSPSFAYQVSDRFAIGGSLGVSFAAFGVEYDVRLSNVYLGLSQLLSNSLCPGMSEDVTCYLPGPTDDIANLNFQAEDNFSLTFNIGLLWEPYQWLSWGIVYQSGSKDELKGYYQALAAADISRLLTDSDVERATWSGRSRIKMEHPQHIATGVKIKLFDNVAMLIDYKWTALSAQRYWKLEFVDPIDSLQLAEILSPDSAISQHYVVIDRGFKDVRSWAFGLMYQFLPNLEFRVGYEDRGNSFYADKLDTLPNNQKLYGLGLSYKTKANNTVDVTVGMLTSHSNIPACTAEINACYQDKLDVLTSYGGIDIDNTLNSMFVFVSYDKGF